MDKILLTFWTVSFAVMGIVIFPYIGAGVTVIMGIIGGVIGFLAGKLMLVMFTPGKTDPATMSDDEKKTRKFEQENLKGFSGGFFGTMAMSITNLMVALTKKPGYQQHPELFALVYGVITLGVGFFRDSVVQDLLNNTTGDDIKKAAEVIDTDD